MTDQGRGAWRWVWCWLSVLVAGCSSQTVFQTNTPVVPTLLGYTRVPPTLTPMLRILSTPALAVTVARITGLAATPLPLTLDPPRCYETPVGSLWCLGLIRNRLPNAVESVTVRIYLVTTDGRVLTQSDSLLARHILRPGEDAPYGILFAAPPSPYAGPVAEVIDASPANVSESARGLLLTVQNAHAETRDATYHVSGQVFNASLSIVSRMALLVTLFDANGYVSGFRQMQIDTPLAIGASTPFEMDVTPHAPGLIARYEITVDALTN